MRLGVLDIGSNTGHLLVVDAYRGAAPLPASSAKEPLRLAEHLADDGTITTAGVDALTGEVRIRRMLAVCAAGRILNPKTARSHVIGAITMGVGAALME